MPLCLYNSLKQKKEEFISLHPQRVGMYVCGVTVYDYCHLGHARASVVFDMIYRYLTHQGYTVTYVRNFTDIDDKIIKKSQSTQTPCPSGRTQGYRFYSPYGSNDSNLDG